MRRFLRLGTILLCACSSDAFFYMPLDGSAKDVGAEAESDASFDSATDSDSDSLSDASCNFDASTGIQAGSSAFDQVMDADSARLKACCNGGCGYPWTEGIAACRAHFAAQTEDCSSATFTSKTVCYADTTNCASAMQSGACNIIMGANPRALCSMFWGQFP